MKGEWYWADLYGPCEQTPRNPNTACFTRVWVPEEQWLSDEELFYLAEQLSQNDIQRARRHARNQAIQLNWPLWYCIDYPPREKANTGLSRTQRLDNARESWEAIKKVLFWGTLIGLLFWALD